MKGRKPKPTVLKLIAGKPGHRALPAAEPQPVGDLVAPPAWLSDEQRAEWTYALQNAPLGLLRRLDRTLFATWCVASCDFAEAEMALRAEGKVVIRGGDERITIGADGKQVKTTRSASKVLNPWVKAKRDAFDRLMKAISELGFSPTSRSRITLAGADSTKQANRFSNNAAPKRA